MKKMASRIFHSLSSSSNNTSSSPSSTKTADTVIHNPAQQQNPYQSTPTQSNRQTQPNYLRKPNPNQNSHLRPPEVHLPSSPTKRSRQNLNGEPSHDTTRPRTLTFQSHTTSYYEDILTSARTSPEKPTPKPAPKTNSVPTTAVPLHFYIPEKVAPQVVQSYVPNRSLTTKKSFTRSREKLRTLRRSLTTIKSRSGNIKEMFENGDMGEMQENKMGNGGGGMNVQCQCGSIKFQTPLPRPLAVYICHCDECRRQSSSAFGCSAIFPNFELPGAVREWLSCYSRPTSSGHMLNCFFCKNCGTRVLHSTPGKDYVSVKGGCIEGLDWKSARHIWCKRAMVPIPEGVERDEEEPSNEVHGDIVMSDGGDDRRARANAKATNGNVQTSSATPLGSSIDYYAETHSKVVLEAGENGDEIRG